MVIGGVWMSIRTWTLEADGHPLLFVGVLAGPVPKAANS
jgi:hypothetical protein